MGVKLKDILKGVKIGSEVGKVFVPGGVGKILDVVNKSIDDDSDPGNTAALKALAEENAKQSAQLAEQEQAIIVLHERLKKLEGK